MVTFDTATLRATPAKNAVRPARAPDDRSRPPIGAFTDPEVMLTMRPNRLAIIGNDHVGDDAIEHFRPVELAEVTKRRTGIIVDQNVRLGAGGEQRFLPVRRSDVGGDRNDLGAGRPLEFHRGSGKPLAVKAVDHDLAASLRQSLGAGPAEAAARGTDNGFPAGDTEIHPGSCVLALDAAGVRSCLS
jgi:hypothetical protein